MANESKTHSLLGCINGIWIRQRKFPVVGDFIGGHKHKFDHTSILASGKVEIMIDGESSIHEAPAIFDIKKDRVHRVKALEEGTVWYCCFVNRDAEGNPFDPESDELMNAESCALLEPSEL